MVDILRESAQLIQSVLSEVLWRRLVFLHTLKVANDDGRLLLLLVNDALEIVELAVHLFRDLVFKLLLIADFLLHLLSFLQIVRAFFLDVFEVLQMHVGCLLKCERLAPMCRIFKITLITERRVVRRRTDLQLVFVLPELDFVVNLSKRAGSIKR